MNATEYKAYTEAVNQFTHENKISPGMWGPRTAGMQPHFSWRPCACCKRESAGDRELYVFVSESGKQVEAICTDCVYFLEYGQLDDLTMLEVEESQEQSPVCAG